MQNLIQKSATQDKNPGVNRAHNENNKDSMFINQQNLSSDLSKAILKKIPASNCGRTLSTCPSTIRKPLNLLP
jgi:hypothetical protein